MLVKPRIMSRLYFLFFFLFPRKHLLPIELRMCSIWLPARKGLLLCFIFFSFLKILCGDRRGLLRFIRFNWVHGTGCFEVCQKPIDWAFGRLGIPLEGKLIRSESNKCHRKSVHISVWNCHRRQLTVVVNKNLICYWTVDRKLSFQKFAENTVPTQIQTSTIYIPDN